MSRESEVAGRKRKAAPASSTLPPAKKPKKITGPPPRSKPFIRRHDLPKTPPISMYWGVSNHYHLQPLFESNGDVFEKLPKLAQKHSYFLDPITDRPHADRQKPVNEFDATIKKHFDAAHAKVEQAVEIMEEQATQMAHLGRMLVEEAQACHEWVGQVGTMTGAGCHGRMKNYDALQDALEKVNNLAMKAEKTVEDVKEHAKKWTEFTAQRRAWDEEEMEYEDAKEEFFEDEYESFADEMEEMRARVVIDRGF